MNCEGLGNPTETHNIRGVVDCEHKAECAQIYLLSIYQSPLNSLPMPRDDQVARGRRRRMCGQHWAVCPGARQVNACSIQCEKCVRQRLKVRTAASNLDLQLVELKGVQVVAPLEVLPCLWPV